MLRDNAEFSPSGCGGLTVGEVLRLFFVMASKRFEGAEGAERPTRQRASGPKTQGRYLLPRGVAMVARKLVWAHERRSAVPRRGGDPAGRFPTCTPFALH